MRTLQDNHPFAQNHTRHYITYPDGIRIWLRTSPYHGPVSYQVERRIGATSKALHLMPAVNIDRNFAARIVRMARNISAQGRATIDSQRIVRVH